MGITNDRGRYYWVRRVPKRYMSVVCGLDGRPVEQVRAALRTDSESAARKKAVMVEEARIAEWEALRVGDAGATSGRLGRLAPPSPPPIAPHPEKDRPHAPHETPPRRHPCRRPMRRPRDRGRREHRNPRRSDVGHRLHHDPHGRLREQTETELIRFGNLMWAQSRDHSSISSRVTSA